MTTADIVAEGVDTTGAVGVFAQHSYQYSTCDPVRNAIATLPHLVDHQNITVRVSGSSLFVSYFAVVVVVWAGGSVFWRCES